MQLLATIRDELNNLFRDIESNVLTTEFSRPRFKKLAFIRNLSAQEETTPLPEPVLAVNQSLPSTCSIWAEFDKEVKRDS